MAIYISISDRASDTLVGNAWSYNNRLFTIPDSQCSGRYTFAYDYVSMKGGIYRDTEM